MRSPSRRVVIPCVGFVLVSGLVIGSTMITAVRTHLQSKILPYLKAPFTSTPTTTIAPFFGYEKLLNMSALSAFLTSNKQAFLADLSSSQGEGWTIVMGNEAGDLDSCATAIAHSYLSATLDHIRTIALIQTPRADLVLRKENLVAFGLARLDSKYTDLLTIDDIPSSIPLTSLKTSYALVDHNRILPKFLPDPSADRVKAIFDHHADEDLHKTANPRLIRVPTGSCASIVTDYFRPRFPPASDITADVSSLLLSAIAIDTGGLKDSEKTQLLDHESSDFLFPLSHFSAISTAENASLPKTIPDLAEQLITSKQAVSHLSGRDLLRRDYKEYEFGSALAGNFTRMGLSTVPMGLDEWFERDGAQKFWDAQEAWVKERGLDVSGILTTFRTKKKQKHKREMLLVFPSIEGSVNDSPSGLELRMYTTIEGNEDLDAKQRKLDGIEGRRARAWEQRNKHATRKTIAPIFKAIIEGN